MAEQKKDQLAKIKDGLLGKKVLDIFQDCLPMVAGQAAAKVAERYAKMVFAAVVNNPALQKCSFPSLVKAAREGASVNLAIDARGFAYLVPYKNNKGTKENPNWVHEANFQIGYMGLIELAFRSGKVKAISAHCIYASEKKAVKITRINGVYEVDHPFSYDKPTGDRVAVYATAEVEGFGSNTLVMRADEVERLRKLSKAKNSPAWQYHPESMWKKTVIRQLAKFLPKEILKELATAAAKDEKADFVQERAKIEGKVEADMGSEDVIDTSFEPVQEQEQGEPVEDNDDFMND